MKEGEIKNPLGCFIVETLNGEIVLEKTRNYLGLSNAEVLEAYEKEFGKDALPEEIRKALLSKRLGC